MKQKKRIILALFLILAVLFPVAAFADSGKTEPTITVSSIQAKPGESVTVDVALSNNPGIAAVGLDVSFDGTVLTLDKVAFQGAFAEGGYQPGSLTSPVRLSWSELGDISTDGVLATLTFTVNAQAKAGDTVVSVSYKSGDICNILEDSVDFTCESGKVAVGGTVEETVELTDAPVSDKYTTITAPVGGWVVGENTFTVESTKACVVLVSTDRGKTYTRLEATENPDGSYSFTASDVSADTIIKAVRKGDLGGDGTIDSAEISRIRNAQAGLLNLSGLESAIADLNGDGAISLKEIAQIRLAAANLYDIAW